MKHENEKRILVAGGAGFLGLNLCRSLVEDGHQVICLDNFSSGSKFHLAHLSSFTNFSILEHDVSDPISINVDEIYNLTCLASPLQYQSAPLQTLRTNIEGIANLLKLAVAKRARIFQVSTSEVYGAPQTRPQAEDYVRNVNSIGPRACYDEGKRCAETLCVDYHRIHKVDVKIARIFNTYGPFMPSPDGRLVSNFIEQALLNRPITIYGDGSQTRYFCYVDDLIAGIKTFMQSHRVLVGPINLGNPAEVTVLELAQKIIALTGSKSRIEFLPLHQDAPQRCRPDIDRARHLLNWEPRIDLDQGLIKTIAYFEKTLRSNATVANFPSTPQIATARRMGGLGEAAL